MILKIIMLVIIVILLVIDYALVVIASEAQERERRLYEKWKRERSNDD